TRNAEIGEYSLEIKSKASSHRIASESLPKNYNIPAGEYQFIIGKEKITVPFSGGTVENFIDIIKKYGKDTLKATITNNTATTQILILESTKTGKDNVIAFGNDKTKDVFQKMNFFEEIVSFDKKFALDKKYITDVSSKKKQIKFLDESTLLVSQEQMFKFTLPEKINYKNGLTMEIDLKLQIIDPEKSEVEEELIPTGPNFGRTGDTEIYSILLDGEKQIINIPELVKKEETKEEKTVITDDKYLEIITNKRTIKVDELDVSETKKTLSFKMRDLILPDETIENIILKNNNTLKKLEVSNLRFYDEDSKSGVRFKQELSKADNALIYLDGLRIERDSNNIDDLIKGVTLNIFDTTTKKERLQIDRDYPKIVSTIVDFIKDYNEIITMVKDKSKVEINDLGEIEGRGVFSGDYGLSSLASKLRTIMMNPYTTQYGQELSLLSQIGVSTNASESRGMNTDKLFTGGVLEINEDKFVEKMEKFPEGVKQLFGYDSNGDLVADTGIGFEVENLLKLYTSKGEGFFDGKVKTIDLQIKDKDKQIASYQNKLKDEEKKLKEQFYKMEKAAQDLQENQKKINNFNKQN
ncbi:MAG TPA: flagellar filament capping protein FliD, partial [Spirochaetota bacterium]|nr:flagellar filament capping protein FliD [Spirochaetota bacterium]